RAEHGGGRQILVHRRQELDAGIRYEAAVLPEFEVEAAERRSAIAGDEAAGVEPRLAVAAGLIQRDAHQRLRPGHEDAARLLSVAVLEAVARKVADGLMRGHGCLLAVPEGILDHMRGKN